jgi:carboxyl-terminal processing protease
VEKMRGPAHSPITLTIVRKGVDAPFEVTMVRDVIHIKPVKYRAENDVGYIQVTSFSEQTTEELEAAVFFGQPLPQLPIDYRPKVARQAAF